MKSDNKTSIEYRIKNRKKYYDFIQMHYFINGELGYDQRDAGKFLYPNGADFEVWYELCGKRYYGENKEYVRKIYAKNKIPYLDFWHWQIQNCTKYFMNGGYSKLWINPEFAENEPEWAKNIQNVWDKEFKHLVNKDGYIDIWVSW